MPNLIKRYPLSLILILVVSYLSFFKPPKTELDSINHIDKVAHFGMYFVMSGLLWLEFFRAHRGGLVPLWHAWVGAFLCPIAFGGVVEIMQSLLTDYRGGDWLDFLANSAGVVVASLVAYCVVRPRVMK